MHCLANIIQETTEVLLGGLLGSFSETEPIRYRERHKRFTISIGSHSYGGWEIHHLLLASGRTRKANGVIPSEPEGPGPGWALVSKSQRTRSSDIWGQENMNIPAQEDKKREGMLPFSSFFSVQALSRLDNCPLWWGWIFFTQSTNSNANFI